ncbi:MAG: exodeoxyribonuclease VII large subunit [Candidatus Tokpelaia sp. JSC161]|nr:MAG: exodeoxyribonuclease VII large subunit [Candidatus Tokpelaia sp. JSC161]
MLKKKVENIFPHVRVRGEISGYRGPHTSGHSYFSLKDDKAKIEVVIWRNMMKKLQDLPENGMETIVFGKISTYPYSSKYQLIIESIKPAGVGKLMLLLEERRQKLQAQGLFDHTRKKKLPKIPEIIGVVSSPSGAVIHDIVHRISHRFSSHILLWPARVQGETSSSEIAKAVSGFNNLSKKGKIPRPDIIIIARGGGSLEDLWSFNEEILIRAVYESNLPVISAVGHETDWTLIDHVADKRAATPTAAAELAVPLKTELENIISSLTTRMKYALSRILYFLSQKLEITKRNIPQKNQLLSLAYRRYDEATLRVSQTFIKKIRYSKNDFYEFSKQFFIDSLISRCLQDKNYNLLVAAQSLPPLILIHLKQNYHHFSQALIRQPLLTIISNKKKRFEDVKHLLKILSFQTIMQRGFALILSSNKKPIKKASDIIRGEPFIIKFLDGEIQVISKS